MHNNTPQEPQHDNNTGAIPKNNTAPHKQDKRLSAFYRAENEVDDGYDPYSDRPSYSPLFEPDPWN